MGGWVGGLTLTIKLISAQLSYAAAEAGLSLAKVSCKKYKQIVQKLQEYCKKFITKLLDSLTGQL